LVAARPTLHAVHRLYHRRPASTASHPITRRSTLISSPTRRVHGPSNLGRPLSEDTMSGTAAPTPVHVHVHVHVPVHVHVRRAPPSDTLSVTTWPAPDLWPPWICWSTSPRTASWSVASVNTSFGRLSSPPTSTRITGLRKGPYPRSARCGRSWHRSNNGRSSTRAMRPCVDRYRPTNRSRSFPCTRDYNAGGVSS
jgi:hypothetical protein